MVLSLSITLSQAAERRRALEQRASLVVIEPSSLAAGSFAPSTAVIGLLLKSDKTIGLGYCQPVVFASFYFPLPLLSTADSRFVAIVGTDARRLIRNELPWVHCANRIGLLRAVTSAGVTPLGLRRPLHNFPG